jgi:hypothetical protein
MNDVMTRICESFSDDGDPGEKVDRLVKRYTFDHPGTDYAVALEIVMRDPSNAELVRAYAVS